MTVSQEIRKAIDGKDGINYSLANGLLDRLEALEENIAVVEHAPHFKSHPQNPQLKKLTVEGRLYREYSASYRDTVIKLYKVLCVDLEVEEESPLRTFLKGLQK
jgi:hypothetical protein